MKSLAISDDVLIRLHRKSNVVSRLLKQLEQLKQSWFECQQHVRHKTVLSTIEMIESWTEVGVVLFSQFYWFSFLKILLPNTVVEQSFLMYLCVQTIMFELSFV